MLLVEGESDRVALDKLARRLGRDLGADGVSIVPMSGATNIAHHIERNQRTTRRLPACATRLRKRRFSGLSNPSVRLG